MTTTRYVSLTAQPTTVEATRQVVDRFHAAAVDLIGVEDLGGVSVSLSIEEEVDEVSEAATALDDLVTGLMLGGDSAPPGDVIAQAQQRLRAALARQ